MKSHWRAFGVGAALIMLLVFVADFPSLHGGFVWDDTTLITENRLIAANDGLYRFWFTTEAEDYWPLTSTAWWLEWRAWGDNATAYRVVNLLLHGVNAILVWIILQRLKIPGAWVAALVFAIHPVNVATAAWISEQKNTLSMLLYLAAILLYLRFDDGERWHWYALSLGTFLLALLSKAAVAMLPVVLLGCVWWRRDHVRWKDLLRSAPFFVLSLVLGLVTVWFQHHPDAAGHPVRDDGFAARLAGAGWAPWFYLSKALWPVNLTMIYPRWKIDASLWVSYVPGIALAGGFMLCWWRRKSWGRPLLFGLGYFVIMLFPVLGFFNQSFFVYSFVADHWQYYSIIGVIALVVAAGERVRRRLDEQRQHLATLFGVGVLLVLGVATWKRSAVYETDATLWRDTLAKNPRSWLAHTSLAEAQWRAGMATEAYEHYQQALRIKPDYAPAYYDLGLMLWQAGKTNEAMQHWEQALRLEPGIADAHYTLGVALMQAGKTNEAMQHWEQAVRINPDDAEAHNDLGSALLGAGRIQEAIKHYEQALRSKPDFAEVHYNLGAALEQTGRLEEAMPQYERALQIKPDFAPAQEKLARLRTGR